MKLKKELGQNFLVDQRIINETIESAQIGKDDAIIEVGAGTGAITHPLAKKSSKVIAVEIDKNLISKLQANLKGLENVALINQDILKLPIDDWQLTSFKVVGSIPYQITSPLVHKFLKLKKKPKSITIIVQKEVAEKIAAEAPKATYLSNFVANFGEAKILKIIKPNAFRPQPKVDSALLHITLYRRPHIKDIEQFEKFLHHGFAQPRKMLNKRFPAQILQKLKIDPKRRPQTLSFKEWQRLFGKLRG